MAPRDPEVCINLNVDNDVFDKGLESAVPGKIYTGKMVYSIQSNRILGSFLGQKWDERILNPNGDFSYVIDETVKYWLGTRTPTY